MSRLTIRIGLIGAGTAARHHLDSFTLLKETDLIAVADISESAARRVSERFRCNTYTDPTEMIGKEKLDIAYICTPHYTRGEVEVLCAEKGVHLFIEKPVALDIDVASKIEKKVSRHDVLVSVGYHWRYSDLTDKAREMISPEEVAMVQGYWMSGMRKAPWFKQKNKSGGQLVEQASHLFDLSRYLVGEVESVYGIGALRTMQNEEDFDIDDVSTLSMRFTGGAIGSLSATCILSPHSEKGWIEALMRRAWNKMHTATGFGRRLEIMRDYRVGISLFGRNKAVDLEEKQLRLIDGKKCRIIKNRRNPYLVENESFLKAIKSGETEPIRCSLGEGVKTLRLSLAAMESVEKGEMVRVGDVN